MNSNSSNRGKADRDQMARPVSNRVRRGLVHGWRWAVFISILILVHLEHRAYLNEQSSNPVASLDPSQLAEFYPPGSRLGPYRPDSGSREVTDSTGNRIGEVVQTAPESDVIIGYAGSSNTLIAFDGGGRILGMRVLHSADTAEHLQTVLRDRAFMERFNRATWNEAAVNFEVDAVSGATLTSLAIAEGVLLRLGGSKPSLRFPEPLTIEEVQAFFTNAFELSRPSTMPGAPADARAVIDSNGQTLGAVTRTPTASSVTRGPRIP